MFIGLLVVPGFCCNCFDAMRWMAGDSLPLHATEIDPLIYVFAFCDVKCGFGSGSFAKTTLMEKG